MGTNKDLSYDLRSSLPPPRVVIIDDFVFPYRVPFFAALAKQYIQLTVLFCAEKVRTRQWKPFKVTGFQHQFLRNLTLYFKRKNADFRTIFLTPTLFFKLLRLNPDVVISYAYSIPTWIAFVYCWVMGRAFISWADGTPHTNKALGPVQKWIRRIIIPRADACLTPTSEGRDTFVGYGASPENIWMILHSASSEFGGMLPHREEPKTDFSKFKKPVAFYAGALNQGKGVVYLLEAIALAQKELGKEIHLVMAGDGPHRGTLEARAKELGLESSVHQLGFVEPGDIPSLYAAADVFVFPSLSDSFGFVIGEAIRCGAPVVGSQFAGASRSLIEPGENGFIIDPTDVAAFAEAIVKVLSDENTRSSMARRSRAIADQFSIDHAVSQCMLAMQNAAARRKHGEKVAGVSYVFNHHRDGQS